MKSPSSARRPPAFKFHWARAAIALVCAATIVAFWAVTWERINFEREGDIVEAQKTTANLALALEQSTLRTFKGADQTLQLVHMEYQDEGARMDRALLVEAAQTDPSLYVFIGIIDARGMVIMNSLNFAPFDISDRDFFKHHRENASRAIFIGTPFVGRVSERNVIIVSRRIDNKDGSFGGVVIAGLSMEYIEGFYSQVDLGAGGLIQLVGLDGKLRARRTGLGVTVGQDMTQSTLLREIAKNDIGSYLSIGRLEGVARYISYRVLREYGMAVAVGVSEESVLAPSRLRRDWYLMGSALATLFVLLFGGGLIGAMRRQNDAMDAALAGEALYRVTFDQAAVGISHHALDGKFLRVNRKYCEFLGYTEAELLGKSFVEMLHPEDRPSAADMQRLIERGSVQVENRHITKDGSVKWGSIAVAVVRDAAGKPDYFVAMIEDITERRKAQEDLERQYHYDALTGLPNRALLFDRVAQTLRQARRKERGAGVLFVNLDRFKAVNDTLGHQNGDLLLREAAARLAASVRADDTVARAGGDEFVVLLPEITDAEGAAHVARKISEAFAAPFQLAEHEVFVTASIGIAIYPGDGSDGETLVKNANAAMARAKQVGRNNYQFYTASLNEKAMEKLMLEADLRRALERNEFLLHYQPKVELAGGRVKGFEALLRWQRADGRLVSPAEFVPLLEDTGMIAAVGAWVIHRACAQLREWRQAGLAPLPVAVNISGKQFQMSDLRAVIERELRDHGIEARLLQVEITESIAMQDHNRVVPVLLALKKMGVRISIDDFGTGYSSLSYLAKLPVHALKIDRSFVSAMLGDANAMTLVQTIISLAHSLKLEVIAEGVEDPGQASVLRLLRCDEMQGYLFSRPLPAGDCAAYLGGAQTETAKSTIQDPVRA